MELIVNRPVKLPFTSSGLTTGLSSFSPIFLVDGNQVTPFPAPDFSEVGSGLYTLNLNPTLTGEWSVFVGGAVQLKFTVVTKTTVSILKDLSDETLESWTWDKVTGVLTLYRGDSSVLATYNITDTVTAAARERVS